MNWKRIAKSHVWQTVRGATRKDWTCLFCDVVIPKGTKGTKKYDQPYVGVYYAHPGCLEKARKAK